MSLMRQVCRKLAVPVIALVALCAVFAVSASAATTNVHRSHHKTVAAHAAAWSNCTDRSIASGSVYSSPGPGPNFSNKVIGTFTSDEFWTLSCHYYNNTEQNRYYAELGKGQFGNNQYGYVWVQRLFYGSAHDCSTFYNTTTIGTADCPLVNVP